MKPGRWIEGRAEWVCECEVVPVNEAHVTECSVCETHRPASPPSAPAAGAEPQDATRKELSSEHSAIVEGLYSLAVEFENDGMPRNANVIRDLAVRTCLALSATPPAAGEPNDHADCATMDDVVREVFCRLFGDDGDAGMAEMEKWRAFDKSGWFHWSRAFGAFLALRMKERASSGATREGA